MRVYIYVSGEYFTHLGFISGFFPQSLLVIGWTSDEITDKVMRHNIIFNHVLIKADFWYQETRKWPIIHPNISLQSLLYDLFPYLPGLLYYTILSNSFQVNKYYLYIYIYNRTHIYYISSTQWLAARSKQTYVGLLYKVRLSLGFMTNLLI